jgi:DNA (cytosine-5)-methyltransferase 1
MLDLFSGIGGFSLAAQWCWGDALEIACFVEIDPFCRQVLKKHWPHVDIVEDVLDLDRIVGYAQCGGLHRDSRRRAGEKFENGHPQLDLLTGGFPCQPFSCAGQRKGTEDDRALWPAMLEVIRATSPRWVVAENVPGLLSISDGLVFESVLTDLEHEGYEVQPLLIPAAGVGAPHRRDRVWIVGHSKSVRNSELNVTYPRKNRFGKMWSLITDDWDEHWTEAASRFCGVASRVPDRVDRLRALGNSIVPQVALQIFKAIKAVENEEGA